MKKSPKAKALARLAPLVTLGLTLMVASGLTQPAQALCGAPFLITSLDQGEGLYSYVETPGALPGGDGLLGSTVTENLDGFFWAVGFGDAAAGVGADNGTFPALDWVYIYPDYPASILTTWAATPEIDTCIDIMGPLGERCMAMVLTDIDPQTNLAAFALISRPDHPASGDFFFTRPGSLPFQLVPMAQTRILSSSRVDIDEIQITFGGPGEEALLHGAYLSEAPQCQVGFAKNTDPFNGLILGYRMYRLTLPRGSAPPTDFRREAWEDLGFPPTPLEAPVNVITTCGGDEDGYYAYTLVFDGGFETSIVSKPTTRIECGPNAADPAPRYRTREPGRQAPTERRR